MAICNDLKKYNKIFFSSVFNLKTELKCLNLGSLKCPIFVHSVLMQFRFKKTEYFRIMPERGQNLKNVFERQIR